jgi:hypothetical protein
MSRRAKISMRIKRASLSRWFVRRKIRLSVTVKSKLSWIRLSKRLRILAGKSGNKAPWVLGSTVLSGILTLDFLRSLSYWSKGGNNKVCERWLDLNIIKNPPAIEEKAEVCYNITINYQLVYGFICGF